MSSSSQSDNKKSPFIKYNNLVASPEKTDPESNSNIYKSNEKSHQSTKTVVSGMKL